MCDNENTRLYGYKIIRNCCIATMLCVTLVSCNNTEKPVFNDDVTTDTDVRTSAFAVSYTHLYFLKKFIRC